MKTKLSMIVVALFVSFSVAAQTAEEILDTYFENIGGVEALSKVEGLKMTAKVNAQGMEIPVEIIQLKDGRKTTSFELQGKTLKQEVYDGETQWGNNFMTMEAEKSDSETIENVKRAAKDDFPAPLFNYKANGHTIELLEKETVEGTECFKIKVTKTPVLVDGKEEENVEFYYFDMDNFVPVMSESEAKTGQAKGMKIQTIYSDYEEVEGIYFPFSIGNKFNGQTGQAINIQKVELNPTVDDAIFAFPAE